MCGLADRGGGKERPGPGAFSKVLPRPRCPLEVTNRQPLPERNRPKKLLGLHAPHLDHVFGDV